MFETIDVIRLYGAVSDLPGDETGLCAPKGGFARQAVQVKSEHTGAVLRFACERIETRDEAAAAPLCQRLVVRLRPAIVGFRLCLVASPARHRHERGLVVKPGGTGRKVPDRPPPIFNEMSV